MRRLINCRLAVSCSFAILLLAVGSACRSSTGLGVLPTHPGAEVYATLSMAGTPFAAAVTPDGVVYVSQLHSGSLARTDLTGTTVKDVISVGMHPSQVRVGPSGRVYVGNQDTPSVGVVDPVAGRQTVSFPLTTSVLTLGVSPDGSRIYALTDFGGVKILDAGNGSELATVAAGPVLTGIAFNPRSPRIYVAARDGGTVTAIDTRLNRVVARFATAGSPQNVAVSPDGAELYVADIANSALQIWDLRTGMRTAVVPIGSRVSRNAFDVAVTPDGAQLWVSTLADGKVFVLDRASRAVERVITTGGSPRYIVFDATGSRAVITNESGWVTFVR
jgi:YVTN family beta-propeller protein